MEKLETLCTVGGNVKWCSHYGKQHGVSSKKLKIELSYEPAIPLLIFTPKTWKRDSEEIFALPWVHCTIIHNSQDM